MPQPLVLIHGHILASTRVHDIHPKLAYFQPSSQFFCLQWGCFDFVEMNFSKTKMTNDGLREVVKFCQRCPELRVLKLFQNQLDDEGCKELLSVFKDCTALEELHLSHNWITEKGVEMLATAALENLTSRFSRPFWLRVEHNNFSYASSFIEDLKTKFHPQICGREDRRHCSYFRCIKDCRMHIPFLVDERGSKGSQGNWGRWNNNSQEEWSYNYDQKYKASHKSRSRSPPTQPIRLKERQLSPPMMRAKRPRERSDRSPIDRRESYYQDTTTRPTAIDGCEMSQHTLLPTITTINTINTIQGTRETQETQDTQETQGTSTILQRLPEPQVHLEELLGLKALQECQAAGLHPADEIGRLPWSRPGPTSHPNSKPQQDQFVVHPPHRFQNRSPNKHSMHCRHLCKGKLHRMLMETRNTAMTTTVMTTAMMMMMSHQQLQQPWPIQAIPGHPGHPGHPPVVVPKMKVSREAAPAPMPSRAPKARPPPRQPPVGAPRAPRARARMGSRWSGTRLIPEIQGLGIGQCAKQCGAESHSHHSHRVFQFS